MLERKLTATVGKAIRDDDRFGDCAIELKLARGEVLRKGEIKEHQFRALRIVSEARMYYKISDESYGAKPFDMFCLKSVAGAKAYIVIWFHLKGKNKDEVWAIDVEEMKSICVGDKCPKISINFAREHGRILEI